MGSNKARALQEAERALAQGKLSQAIQYYLEIIENDPSDLALINTTGDLCVRDNSIPQALKLFRKLAEAYTREGFVLRAIAIYKKILKVGPQDADAMLRLGDLYAQQGLTREARDLYAHALGACRQQNLRERATDVLLKLVASEPRNAGHRLDLAESFQAAGRIGEAVKAYLEASEMALEQGDAGCATAALERASVLDPGSARVAALRKRLFPETGAARVPVVAEESAAVAAERPAGAAAPPESAVRAGDIAGSAAVEIDLTEEWEAWSRAHSAPEAAVAATGEGESPPAASLRVDHQSAGATAATPAGKDALGDLARQLESGWSGPEAPQARQPQAAPADFAASLTALLNEAAGEAERPSEADDPQTHYELGIAFREMGLVDEAIGEFQSVVRQADAGTYPPQFLPACSLLALCFSEKQMPALAVMWYERALQMPGLDAQAALALHYELGLALEYAGNLAAARDNFLQVYSRNIDYRDVADKVRKLVGKP